MTPSERQPTITEEARTSSLYSLSPPRDGASSGDSSERQRTITKEARSRSLYSLNFESYCIEWLANFETMISAEVFYLRVAVPFQEMQYFRCESPSTMSYLKVYSTATIVRSNPSNREANMSLERCPLQFRAQAAQHDLDLSPSLRLRKLSRHRRVL